MFNFFLGLFILTVIWILSRGWPYFLKFKLRFFPRQILRIPEKGMSISPYFMRKIYDPKSKSYTYENIHKTKELQEYVILYFSGFTAGTEEIFPIVETIADQLGVLALFHRHPAHGGDPRLMTKVQAEDYVLAARESYHLAREWGRKVIVIGTSTGAALGFDLAFKESLHSLIMISPNFRLRDWRAEYCRGPLGRLIVRSVLGKWIHVQRESDEITHRWIRHYPTMALSSLVNLTAIMASNSPKQIPIRCLAFFADQDPTIDSQFGMSHLQDVSKIEIICIHSRKHVLAGQWSAPENISFVVDKVLAFLKDQM